MSKLIFHLPIKYTGRLKRMATHEAPMAAISKMYQLQYQYGSITRSHPLVMTKSVSFFSTTSTSDLKKEKADLKKRSLDELTANVRRSKNIKPFISYSWKNRKEVDAVEAFFKSHEISLVRDENTLKYKDCLRKFMQNIRIQPFAILMISEEYLKSQACMHEAIELLKEINARDRMLPVILNSARIYKEGSELLYIQYWEEQRQKQEKESESVSRETSMTISENLKDIRHITLEIGSFIKTLRGMLLQSFEELEKNNYRALLEEMVVRTTTGSFISEKESEPQQSVISNIFQPPPINHYFVSREELITEINQKFAKAATTLSYPYQLAVCKGMAGSGKTHLARHYLWTHHQHYHFTAWFDAQSLGHLLNQYRALLQHPLLAEPEPDAPQVKSQFKTDQEVCEQVAERLSKKTNTLLVFDNIECTLSELEPFLPKTGNHRVLITTRRSDWPNIIPIGKMTPAQSQALITSVTGIDHSEEEKENLSRTMGYLPLAVVQASAYIRTHKLSISDYLVRYHRDKEKYLSDKTMPAGLANDHKPVWVTYRMIFDSILATRPDIHDFLKMISFLNPYNISKTLFKNWLLTVEIAKKDEIHSAMRDPFSMASMLLPFISSIPFIYIGFIEQNFLPIFMLMSMPIAIGMLSPLVITMITFPKMLFFLLNDEKTIKTVSADKFEATITLLTNLSLIEYNQQNQILSIHPLLSEFLYSLSRGDKNFKDMIFSSERQFLLSMLLEQFSQYYTAERSKSNLGEVELKNILNDYEHLYQFMHHLIEKEIVIDVGTESFTPRRLIDEEIRIESKGIFVFFMDLFELCLDLNDITRAEKYLTEANTTITRISSMLKLSPKKYLGILEKFQKEFDTAREKLDAAKIKHEEINSEQNTHKI